MPRYAVLAVLVLAGCADDTPAIEHVPGCLDGCAPGGLADVWAFADGSRVLALGADGALVEVHDTVHDSALDWLGPDLEVTASAPVARAFAAENTYDLALAADGSAAIQGVNLAGMYFDGALHALDPAGGERWHQSIDTELAVAAAPARIYLAPIDPQRSATYAGTPLAAPFVAGVDVATGALAWTFHPPPAPSALPETASIAALPDGGVVAGVMFAGAFDAGAIHLDAPAEGASLIVALAADGAPRWAAQIGKVSATSAVVPQVLRVAAGPHGEIAVLFDASQSANVAGTPIDIAAGGGVALFGADGALRFAVGSSGPLTFNRSTSLATDGATIYAATSDPAKVVAFDASGQRWSFAASEGGGGGHLGRILGLTGDSVWTQVTSLYDTLAEEGDPPPTLELAGKTLKQPLAVLRIAR